MNKTIHLNIEEINKIDLSYLNGYIEWCGDFNKFFNLNCGKEHYKLLAYLSLLYKNDTEIFCDIGTFNGFSALALTHNDNLVYSFEICDIIPDNVKSIKNHPSIVYKVEDCLNSKDILLSSKIILIDIDHTGVEEKKILDFLRENNYKGIVIFDDIHLNDEMINFFKSIPEDKYDLTKYGHWSGTGLVSFNKKLNIIPI